jgi:hypothetical protein
MCIKKVQVSGRDLGLTFQGHMFTEVKGGFLSVISTKCVLCPVSGAL